jgi:hypothetical protein
LEIEQGRHRRVPRADRCCPIEGCGRLVEDEGHLMECPLYFNPRITLGLNARFDITDEQMKEVFTPFCRVRWRLSCGNASELGCACRHVPAPLDLHCGASVLCRTRESCMHPPHFWPRGGRPVSRLVWGGTPVR